MELLQKGVETNTFSDVGYSVEVNSNCTVMFFPFLPTQSQFTPLLTAAERGASKIVLHLLEGRAATHTRGHVSLDNNYSYFSIKKILVLIS